MDRKTIIILIACFLLFMGWTPLVNRLFPPLPAPQRTNTVAQTSASSNRNSTVIGANELETGNSNLTSGPVLSAATPRLPFRTNAPEETMFLENDLAKVMITSYGGGIKEVELKHHYEAVGSDRRANAANTNLATLNANAKAPVLAVLDGEAVEGDGLFTLARINQGVRAEKRLTNGLFLVKEFRLSSNYVVEASVRFENESKQPLVLPPQEWITGTATPMGPRDRNTSLEGVMAYHSSKTEEVNELWFANRTLGCLPGVPRSEFQSGTNVVWAAVYNQFFTLAVVPRDPALRLVARKIDLPPPTSDEVLADSKLIAKPIGLQASMIYPGLQLAAGQKVERHFVVYAGPKEYNTLARLGQQLNNNLDLVMGFGGFFGFFAKLLLLSMNGLNAFGIGYGLAIIVITVLIKLLFWPLTNASTRSMKRMAALQPQMKAIQAKYKEDPKKMNSKMMEFMKEHRISPMSGCFPVLLQIPVFFGFYRMLQSAIELRGARFLWASDLSTADTIWNIPGLNFPVNPLPLLMGVTMIWQARMTPPSPGMDPVQQKMMKYMPLMFMVFLYNFSAGLTLYWTVQNLLSILQMKLTKNVDPVIDAARKSSASALNKATGPRRIKP
jgi:YidC/Oxa1 family membrane protein insertase